MKRFILFAGLGYNPRGGWRDFKDSFDSLEEAKKIAAAGMIETRFGFGFDWFHVVDQTTFEMVAQEWRECIRI